MESTDRLVPVTVVAGYLGAGKTTLINRLLADDHGRRLAVLVNDFGSLNVDAALVAAAGGNAVSLENGCVCCTIGDALGEALDQVLALEPPPDQIVVEASGVADPAKVAVYGQGWPGCRLDLVVTVADVETVRHRADDRFVGPTVRRQLAAADAIVATRADLVAAATLADVERWLATTAPGRPVLASDPARPPTDLLLAAPSAPRAAPAGRTAPGGVDGPGSTLPDADELFATTIVDCDGLEAAALEAEVASWDAVRAKGFVVTADGALRLVQRAGDRISIDEVAGRPDRLAVTTGVVVLSLADTSDDQR